MLEKGDKIPTKIKIYNHANKLVSLDNFLDSSLIVHFYPKTFGESCTQQAEIFNDLKSEFQNLGYKIIGVSPDPVEDQRKFKERYDLDFELLADPESKLHQAFGVWQEKRIFYKTYMGTIRSTFVIDKKGKVIKSWSRFNPKKHIKSMLRYLRRLTSRD